MNPTKFQHVPFVGNKGDVRQKEEDDIRELMQKPGVAKAIAGMAEELAKNFNSSTKIITDIRVGATFLDMWSKKLYAYEYIARGFLHDIKAKMVMQEAKQPLRIFDPSEIYMLIYDPQSNPSPRYIIDAFDFCKYFAIGAWVLQDANNAEEKDFLKKVQT